MAAKCVKPLVTQLTGNNHEEIADDVASTKQAISKSTPCRASNFKEIHLYPSIPPVGKFGIFVNRAALVLLKLVNRVKNFEVSLWSASCAHKIYMHVVLVCCAQDISCDESNHQIRLRTAAFCNSMLILVAFIKCRLRSASIHPNSLS